MELKEAIIKNGFKTENEFFELVSSIDLSSSEKLTAFEKWKTEDGSKEGLLKLKEAT